MGRAWVTLALVVASTVVGLMGTDLVLPAVPLLPDALGGDASGAQLVVAAYVGGSCAGLLGFGALSQRFTTRALFIGSLISTAALSWTCSISPSLNALVALRAVQGAAAAGPAVFAPAVVKVMFDEARAMRALGLLGSIESLAPALAPIAGAVLLSIGGWKLSFKVLAISAGVLAVLLLATNRLPQVDRRVGGSYLGLLRDLIFLRYALSQALVLGGLLTFVFGMPAVFVRVLGGSIVDFIVMQVSAIVTFMVAANFAGRAAERFGAERMITLGTMLAAVGSAGQLAYALAGGAETLVITSLFVPVNIGLGLRGPPGFYRAVLASRGDDARGSALVVLGILGAAAIGTALVAPWIEEGTIPLAGVSLVMHAAAAASLALLPRLNVRPAGA
ncbi:MFS transporter [Sphingomonas mucosissima]|uniref:Bicyclomycin resistance protein n=1 Tax=Sphingomonas mucosissima TaxID=370959 RepID=A0A245ZJS3_9SPHN|nr:MFS transporter [Sphingomonas mucosissima]OWK29987.1 bicyclomycin resistance protein [Sphingomonas mucosissima]